MTRKEAKEVLQEQIDKYGQEYDDEGIETLEVAIKVLKYGEINPCVTEDRATCVMVIDILKKIEKCDETSATKCYTTINQIKDMINRSDLL